MANVGKYQGSIMAFNKIGGDLLESNLLRATDLAFQTDLLYLDVDNNRIGVKTNAPGNYALDVNGSVRVQTTLTVVGDLIVEGRSRRQYADPKQRIQSCHRRRYNDQ